MIFEAHSFGLFFYLKYKNILDCTKGGAAIEKNNILQFGYDKGCFRFRGL